jgi:hypothetical protein
MCLCRVRRRGPGAGSKHTYRDRRLSILELAQRRRALLGAEPVADALDKPGVRGPGEDNGTAHRGRAEKSDVLVVRKGW